MEEKLEERLK
jgi:hypothetical protein